MSCLIGFWVRVKKMKGVDIMACIKSTGAYVPFHRLKREEIGRAWGSGPLSGEKAIANYDEDSITMAVEAGMDCLSGFNREEINALYFASTTAPYREKQAAALIANALALPRNISTADFSGSLRAGTNAIMAAMDAVSADPSRNVLVIASDCRLGVPGSNFEQVFGDGAAALIVGSSGNVRILKSYSHAEEIIDIWRTQEDRYVKMWEERFVFLEGYIANVREAVTTFLREEGSTLKDFTKVVLFAPDQRNFREVARMLRLEKEQIQNPLLEEVGNTGAAHALMMMVNSLEEAKAGDRLLLVSYGDGCDLFVLQVEEEFSQNPERRGIRGFLKSRMFIKNYEKYIQMKRLMQVETGRRRPPAMSSASVLHRDRDMVLGLYAGKCKGCGRLFFPPQRVCLYCRTKDQYDTVRLADKKGKLFTFCKDFLAQSIDPPVITSIVHLDLEEGVRVFCTMSDRDPDTVKVDMPVEMTFKKISEAEGFFNYFWKCRPVR
ncbi:MAG: 3-hydroxy-3-methylglutaryl CoA synthase [Deltaproteobacteria bacterium CG12_big_fil_rev_8_21_14_0_65_43_10]|nr:MAG: 3-hydroxy-3-methylglutaryl CoA synthase [Deltaproteobacteria bacterium CG12_big_fil_rev_8_21_14_0_65_43_10]HCX89188.1 3-hydroxy-3-methylglutaryl CoA synthase [Deltaproteobacteria bacterium]